MDSGHIKLPRGADQETALAAVYSNPALQKHIKCNPIVRVVFVPDELVNLVVKP